MVAGSEIFATAGNSITWNGSLWVTTGGYGSGYSIAYSYNGINWIGIEGSIDLIYEGHDVKWNGLLFVLIGKASASADNTILDL